MRTINQNLRTLLLVVFVVAALTSCSKENTVDPDLAGVDESLTSKAATTLTTADLAVCIDSFAVEPLSTTEISSLNAMREEELLAMDIYTNMYALYKMPVFSNISKSELQHTSAVKALIDKYGIADVAANHISGVFTNTDLQTLYYALLAKGEISLNDALTVGATIEDLDINDLANHIADDVDNEDILFVYNNLERGSRNHIRAFYRILKKRGITYVPQYISQEYLSQIINSPNETGSGCRN